MTEPERTAPDDAESETWVRSDYAIAGEQAADGHKAFEAYYRIRRIDGVPQVDALVLTGVGIDARALRGMSPARSLALVASTPAETKHTVPELQRLAAVDRKLRGLLEALDAVWSPADAPAAGQREPLSRPDGTDPEGFSRRVAAAYRSAVAASSTPAKVLAEEAGVPVPTVHRWIRDARRLGLIPPTRRGRAG